MPKGMHGIFPVSYGDAVLLAGGGVKAAGSNSALSFAYGLPERWCPVPPNRCTFPSWGART
jgi:hypothetical protein